MFVLAEVIDRLAWLAWPITTLYQQRIEYKVLAITYKTLQSRQLSYLHCLLSVTSNRTTYHSSATLKRPSVRSELKVTNKSFTRHSPVLWSSLDKQLQHTQLIPLLASVNTTLLYFGIFTQTTPAALDASITWHYNWFHCSTCPLFASVSL